MLQKVGLPSLADGALLKAESFIDGAWTPAESGARFTVTNPADGLKLAEVANAGAAEATRAIAAAQRAMPAWRAKTAKERAAILRKWFELIVANQEDLAKLMTAEQGKPLAESRGEVLYGASFIEWFAEEGQARLRRHDSHRGAGQAAARPEGADRGLRGHHALELPERDDHAQGRTGPRRRLHGRRQAGRADAAVGAGARRTRRARRLPRGRLQHRHRGRTATRSRSARCCAIRRSFASCRSPDPPRSAAS